MSHPTRSLLLPAALTTAILLAAGTLGAPSVGRAGDETAATAGLAGHEVVLLMATAPGATEYVEDVTGIVIKSDDSGVLLQSTLRTLIDGSRRSNTTYEAQLYVPWSSVLYAKIKQ